MKKRQVKTLKFSDPKLVRLLCGPQNKHFSILENKLDLFIEAPGDEVNLSGKSSDLSIASHILQKLYEQLKSNRQITENDINILLRNILDSKYDLSKTDHFKEETIPLKNQKKIIGRTPAQSEYIKALKAYQLVFGIGPAAIP